MNRFVESQAGRRCRWPQARHDIGGPQARAEDELDGPFARFPGPRGDKFAAGRSPTEPGPPGAADSFLKFSAGVIHVGANTGQERDLYAQHGLRVVWIEPIPEVYNDLLANIRGFSDQIAINALITDLNDKEYDLHVASNDGASSSILELHHHYDIWPQIHYVRDVRLKSSTLPTALEAGGIDFQSYDSLVIDTQGSELQVLAGAADILPHFKWIKTEAADFEAYKRCTTVSELTEYLRRFDFRILQKERFATRAQGGAYYDILFGR